MAFSQTEWPIPQRPLYPVSLRTHLHALRLLLLQAAPTFTDFLRWPNREVVRVAILRPRFRLSGWTAVGGSAPNTYQIALPRMVFTALVTGGLFRQCVGVKENATALIPLGSVAAVDAAAGSWYWDSTAEILYAHSSTGSDPDTFTVYHAEVEFRFATTGLVIDLTDGVATSGLYHHPWLTSDVPSVTSRIEDFFFGQKVTATSRITLVNAHFLWYHLLAPDGDYWWPNTKVTFYVGGRYNGQSLPWSQYVADLTLEVQDIACDDELVHVDLKPLARRLHLEVPPTPYFESDYPNLGDGVRGTKKWIGYGRTTLKPDLTDTSSSGVWTIADAAYQTLFAVNSVNAVNKSTGVLTFLHLGIDYTVDLTACTLTIINPTFAWQTYDLEVEVTGKPDGTGSYLKTVGAIVRDLLVTFTDVTVADIDTAAFSQADVDAPEELAVWVKDPRTLSALLSSSQPGLASIEGSVLATIKDSPTGQWTIQIWSPDYDPATVPHLSDVDFALFRPEPTLESIFAETRVYYWQQHRTKEWSSATHANPEVGYLANTSDTLERYTFLRTTADAEAMAQRMQLLAGAQKLEVEFQERGSLLAAQLAGDRVLVTRNPAPSVDGQFTDKPFEIIRLDRGPQLAIAGRLSDLRGIGPVVAHWKADSALAWSALTPSERAADPGFWCDDTGQADSADPSSQGVSVWW